MTDSVNQLRQNASWLMHEGFVLTARASIKAANEIEFLRQRVAELEKLSEAISRDCNNTALERNALQAELAALKQQNK